MTQVGLNLTNNLLSEIDGYLATRYPTRLAQPLGSKHGGTKDVIQWTCSCALSGATRAGVLSHAGSRLAMRRHGSLASSTTLGPLRAFVAAGWLSQGPLMLPQLAFC